MNKLIDMTKGHDFIFSIIMPIYNSETYLRKSIDSIINQSFNFFENVQLILIDDGSIDQSKELCIEYQEKYPNNVLFLSQDHKGVASARNLGLDYACGEYINFLDSDDYLSKDALYEVYSFFKEYSNLTDVVSIPIVNFEKNKENNPLNYKFSEDRIINLILEPNSPQISVSSSFIKSSSINKLRFNEDLAFGEDCLFVNEILLNKKTLGVLSKPKYYFRKRYNLSAISDKIKFDKKYFTDRLENLHLKLLKEAQLNNDNNYGDRFKILEDYFNDYPIIPLKKDKDSFFEELDFELNSLNDYIFYYKYKFGLLDDDILSLSKDNLNSFDFEVDNLNKFIQYTLAYDLLDIISMEEIYCFEEEDEEIEFYSTLDKVLNYIDDDVIMDNSNIKNGFLRSYFLYLKYKKFNFEIINSSDYLIKSNNSKDYNNFLNHKDLNSLSDPLCLLKINDIPIDCLNNHNIWLNNFDVNDGFLYISGFLNCLFDVNTLSIDMIMEKDNIKEIITSEYLGGDIKRQKIFMSHIWEDNFNFEFKIPIEDLMDSKLNIAVNFFKDGNKNNRSDSNIISCFLPIQFSKKLKTKSLFKESKLVCFDNNSFFISRGFKFSIVMAIYNTEEYLNEAIDSVINQTMDFEDNVQLVLIDDGSIDRSKEICLEYKERYPDNIVLLSQENSGQAAARNNGIKYVKGKYVNFLDSDDKLSNNALDEVYKFFEEHFNQIDFLALPMIFFGRKNDPHMLNEKFYKTRVIDLKKEPNNPQFATTSSFVKYDVLDKFRFPTDVSFSEDAIAVNKLLLEKKKYGVINTANHFYRKREDLSSTIDNVSKDKSYFTDKLKYYYMELISYSLSKEGEVPDFIKYTMAYDLQWMLKQPDIDILETKLEKNEFWYYLREVIKYISDDAIFKNKYVTDNIFKSFFYYVKKDDLHEEYHGNHDVSLKINNRKFDSLRNHNIWIDIVAIKDDVLTIAGFLNSHMDIKNVSFEAVKEEKNGNLSYFKGKYVQYTSRKDITYLNKVWQFKHSFEIKIPLSPLEESKIWIKTFYHKNGDKTNYDEDNVVSAYLNIGFSKHARLSKLSNYLIKDDHMVIFDDNTFFVWPYSYKSMLKREHNVRKLIKESQEEYNKEALKLRLVYMICYPFYKLFNKNKETWLFMDRPDVADDNAMHLFKYANTQKDNIKKYYIVSKDCKDYKIMKKIGKVLDYKSFKEKLYYLFADKIISTHPYESIINPFFEFGKDERQLYSGLMTSEIYFLQHGVTKDNISSWLTKYDKNFSLIVTVSDEERMSFFDEGYAFDDEVVQVLGFPRYDNLKNDSVKKEILIIPTWRKYLRGNKQLFINSDYFKSLNSLLTNEKLIDLCENEGYTIVFKPHPELDMFIGDSDERYRDLLDINEKIVLSTERSYQELFNDASILITDYSSVFFDFAYMKKPVIYYHPNDDYHYGESYFEYETMGFGDVIDNEEVLAEKILDYISKDCMMEEKYKERVDNFFKYTDRNNCKRVYDWIKND